MSWFRPNPNGACGDGGTTGNTANQLQFEYSPNVMMKDRIFYTALLGSDAQVKVTIGGLTQTGMWEQQPFGGVGLFHGSVPIKGATGVVTVTVLRGSQSIATVNGISITTSCPSGLNNYNAWTGSNRAPAGGTFSTPMNLAVMNCTEGFGVYDFAGLCDFSCHNGYCPSGACVCLNKGIASPPNITGVDGYPAAGKSMIYTGLCSFDCNHGYCPPSCGTTPNPGLVPTFSPFLPPTCTGGKVLSSVSPALTGLCDFSCTFGFCPIHVCECLRTGVLVDAPAYVDTVGYFLGTDDDHGLCNFACTHNYCPDVCGNRTSIDGGSDTSFVTVTLDPVVWSNPTATCPPPCILVFPPITLPTPTTIYLPPLTTTLEIGWSTTRSGSTTFVGVTVTTTIIIPALTTSVISFSNVHVTTTISGAIPSVIFPEASISPPPVIVTQTSYPPGAPAQQSITRTIRPQPWPYFHGDAPSSSGASTTTTTTTSDPVIIIPVVTTFPTETVSWISEWVSQPTTTTDSDGRPVPVIPCWIWFIWVSTPGAYPTDI